MKVKVYAWGYEVNRGRDSSTAKSIASAYGYTNSRAQYKEFDIEIGDGNAAEIANIEDLKKQHYGTGWVWSRG